MIKENKGVLLGMSGGTDSSVAAMLLSDAGYEVSGVTFRFHDGPGSEQAIEDARELAAGLGIPHLVYDARDVFRREVVDYFVREYMCGRTPVPCTVCNNLLKWPLLAHIADEKDIFYISTGHYIRKTFQEGKYYIAPAEDTDKDQTFFLWGLSQEILRRMLLPMGDVTKTWAREFARERGFLKVADKKDSLGVCFCPMDYRGFLRAELSAGKENNGKWELPGKGNFVDEAGNVLGQHEGYPFYTIGQRRGLIYLNRAVFVKEIGVEKNEVVLAPLHSLEKTEFFLKDWRLTEEAWADGKEQLVVKVRYRKQHNQCTLIRTAEGRLHIRLTEPLAAVASGQAAAFYKEGLLVGGGIIC
ncbi:MAG: tRNA 2-thiouridine(34) synthase MnmA [Bacteroides sp.]|nr:tRNA 2-thiouridine(34) synthase MnmA [Bacteroides sp.]